YIAAADDDADLDTGGRDLVDLPRQAFDDLRVDAVISIAHQRFTAELQEDSFVLRIRHPTDSTKGVRTKYRIQACIRYFVLTPSLPSDLGGLADLFGEVLALLLDAFADF